MSGDLKKEHVRKLQRLFTEIEGCNYLLQGHKKTLHNIIHRKIDEICKDQEESLVFFERYIRKIRDANYETA